MDNRFVQFATAANVNKLFDELTPLLTIDPLEFWRDYFDIDTCKTEGLNNWGRILNFSRVISINVASEGVFGFGKEGDYPIDEDEYPQNFNNGFFYNPAYEGTPIQYTLSDYEFRVALKFRYAALTTNLSMQSINRIMNNLLTQLDATYRCVVTQTAVMQLTYKFNLQLTPWQKTLFNNRNILPVPAGVIAIILDGQTI